MTETQAPNFDLDKIEVDADAYNAFVRTFQLRGIDCVKIEGERLQPGLATSATFEMRSASFATGETDYFFRYEMGSEVLGEGNDKIGALVVAVVLSGAIPDFASASEAVAPEVLAQFGGTSGLTMVYPFLREQLQSLALRLGFPGVLVPVIVRTA